MSSSNNELSTVSNQELGKPVEKHNSYDSGWRQEADGSAWREKGDSDYQKTENATADGGFERTESYLILLFLFSFPFIQKIFFLLFSSLSFFVFHFSFSFSLIKNRYSSHSSSVWTSGDRQ